MKSSRPWIADRIVEKNEPGELRAAVQDAASAEGAGEAMSYLTHRSWIGPAVGSTLLTFIDPARYTVSDQRAIGTLEACGYDLSIGSAPSANDYVVSYLPLCRQLLDEYSVSEIETPDGVPPLRVLDRALWMLGAD